ncbi:MAG: response regulator [Bacteroides sp.]|nr:response regulator [Roseburia sp.]MCM1346129.1 response regulator [Bacteroides sp.]MCM1420894.1 response regulator [Bacteroides sp.]
MKKNLFLLLTVITLCLTDTTYSAATARHDSFMHVNSETGLSQSNVKAIAQDNYGFIWLGTKNGLNRYDGQRVIRVYCYDEKLHCGNQNISALFSDSDNVLWVGTDEGVYRYNQVTETFSFVDTKTADGISMKGWVADIKEDQDGNIWIVVPDNGIFKYDMQGNLKLYSPDTGSKSNMPINVCVCSDGSIWSCAWNIGLLEYDRKKDEFVTHTKDANGKSLLNIETNTLSQQGDNLILAVQNGELKKYDYKRNMLRDITLQNFKHTYVRNASVFGQDIYVGTYNGLYVLNEKNGVVRHYRQSINNKEGLSDNIIYTTFQDRENGIWIGTMFGGANYMANRPLTFKHHNLSANNGSFITDIRVREMAEDGNGTLWIGTENSGIKRMSLKEGVIEPFQHSQLHEESDITLSVSADNRNIYCGLYKDGFEVIDKTGKSFYYKNGQLHLDGSVYSQLTARNGEVYVGTDRGAYKAESNSFDFHPIEGLKDLWVFDIMQEGNGDIWFATMGNGVVRYDAKNGKYIKYNHEKDNAASLSSTSVSSIMQDSKGNIWFSTDRGGVCRYNRKTNDFTRYSIMEGLPDDVAYKILEDRSGNMWFGTNRGLVMMNPEDGNVRVFTMKDGLCENQFNYKSAVAGSDGKFYFGTINGLLSFDPEIKCDKKPAGEIYLTRLSIFNEEMKVGMPESPLEKSILETEEIVLPYNRTNISLDFALLSYSTAFANQYYYKLDPIDSKWVSIGTEGNIQYANLNPGTYTLYIRATSEGPEEYAAVKTLRIKVLPPWWMSVWAICLYFVLLACIVYGWFLWYREHKNKQLKEKQKLFEIEKEKELYQNKVNFFTEIAHEIRTPLTLINGPLEIIEEMNIGSDKLAKNLKVISQNTKRLLNLASQLLDFQKIGANKLKPNYEVTDVSSLLKETVDRFEPTFTHQGKVLENVDIEDSVFAKIDKEAITKILSNLLNNARKYGEHNISVSLKRANGNFVLTVFSDGERIPKEKAEQIFDPFYQYNERKEKAQGVGIGLSLSRSLAEIHDGSLYLDLQRTDGNSFVLSIPLNMEMETAETVVAANTDVAINDTGLFVEENAKGKTLLIVEDERSILSFMEDRLSESFVVETAENGRKALEILHKAPVDLVISDVMMPDMNGFELCQAIKGDIELCHIPVVFLTAKNDTDSKIQGLKVGAEAYIEKPFSFEYLRQQVMSLLGNRQNEREAFSKRPFFPVKNMQMSKEDEAFMKKVLDVINSNLDDETFNVERMAEELCMSRSSLLRKIKTLFNMAPLDFIRLIRLKKAAELIQEGKYRVGEICFMVGFNSHSYFSKLFSKQFGMTPKDFEKKIEQEREKSRGVSGIKIEDLIPENTK